MSRSLSLLTLRRIGYAGAPIAAAVGLLSLAATAGQSVFSPGDLSSGHSVLSEECGRCHTAAFPTIQASGAAGEARAMNAGCLDCHGHTIAHDRIESLAMHGIGAQIPSPSCATCHAEHRDPLLARDRACLDCHEGLDRPIGSFEAHPELQRPPDPNTIQFDHSLHTGSAPRNGSRFVQLRCDDCHRTQGGAYMAPIRYSAQCQGCHPLKAPHVASSAGDEGCALCHRVEGQPSIVASAIRERWYLRARFNHGKHTATAFRSSEVGSNAECFFCHGPVLASRKSEEVSLPDLNTCRQCHGSGRTNASDACTACHSFHLAPGEARVHYDPNDRELLDEGRDETRFGMKKGAAQWPLRAFFDLPRVVWNKPDLEPGMPEFNRELFVRYGLFPADFENDRLPLGLIKTEKKFKGEDGFTVTCEICHSSSLFGQIVIGQPNRFSNIEQMWIDLGIVSGERQIDPLYRRNPGHNTVLNGADQLGLIGLMVREPGLTIDAITGFRMLTSRAQHLKPEIDELAYVKTPPWFLYRIKRSGAAGYYYDGGYPKDGNFAAFTYLPAFYDFDGADVRASLARWQRSGHAYLESIEASRYPFPIDSARAARGSEHYDRLCAECHGRIDGGRAIYPGIVVPQELVKTDPLRAQLPASFARRMKTILGEVYTRSRGYVAPPLIGIWALAPYLHNGSIPTLMQLLDPPRRVARFALIADPDQTSDYDPIEVGWRIDPSPPADPPPTLRIVDPALVSGLDNGGHTYGAELSSEERVDLIEFLKTL